jgi:SNF2 family DNA or RNA helicase
LDGRAGKVAGLHAVLEMFLDSPSLVSISAKKYKDTNGEHGSKNAVDWAPEMWGLRLAKRDYLDNKLGEILKQPDGKVIIFTQYKEMVELLAEHMSDKLHGGTLVTYHGGMTKLARSAAVAKFQQDPDCRVFISSHAGGYGVDLPQANWLIHYDVPWSFGKDHQFSGRHVRASSEHERVYIVHMACERTIEERKLDNIYFKQSVSDAVLDGHGAVLGKLDNDVSQLKQWLLDTLDPR